MKIIRDDAFTIARMPGDETAPPHLYLTNCVLSGPYYTENGRPAYLQADPYSSVLKIVGGWQGLALNFALGKDGRYLANKTVRHYGVVALQVPPGGDNKTFWVWAELGEGDRLTFGLEDASLYKVTHSYKEPENPSQGDYWFDMENNTMKRWNPQVPKWDVVRRIIIGKIGVGSDGNIYSMTSYPFRKDFAELHREYINFDGVSFVTGGQYAAENYEKWWQNADVVENIVENYQAFKAMVFSDYVDGIFNRIFSYPGGLTKVLGSSYVDTFVWGKKPYETKPVVFDKLYEKMSKSSNVSLQTISNPNNVGLGNFDNVRVIYLPRQNDSVSMSLDVTEYSKLHVYLGRTGSPSARCRVTLKGIVLFEAYVGSFSERVFDISEITGMSTLVISNDDSDNDYVMVFGIKLTRG